MLLQGKSYTGIDFSKTDNSGEYKLIRSGFGKENSHQHLW